MPTSRRRCRESWPSPQREWALALLWHLTEDPGERRALLTRLDPRALPAHVAADLGAADDAELHLLQHASVRRAAAEGLVQVGAPAQAALRTARDHARPDRRDAYDEVLAQIEGW